MINLVLKRIAAFTYMIASCFIVGLAIVLPFSEELMFSWIPFVLYPITVVIIATSDIVMSWTVNCLHDDKI